MSIFTSMITSRAARFPASNTSATTAVEPGAYNLVRPTFKPRHTPAPENIKPREAFLMNRDALRDCDYDTARGITYMKKKPIHIEPAGTERTTSLVPIGTDTPAPNYYFAETERVVPAKVIPPTYEITRTERIISIPRESLQPRVKFTEGRSEWINAEQSE